MRSLSALALAAVIPLSTPSEWQELTFKKIPANKVAYSEKGLFIQVQKSSSPLIHKLSEPLRVQAFKAKIKISGDLKTNVKKFPEDAYLRLGLVAPGERKMSMMERMIAPDWMKRLFRLAPSGQGVDKIYFFDLVDHGAPAFREFPGSKGLMFETLLQTRTPEQNEIEFQHELKTPIETVALWLSVDGDDSGSTYDLTIERLTLEGDAIKPQHPEKSESDTASTSK